MSDKFKQYIISLYQDIPQEVYEGLLSVFCVGVVLFIAWKGFKTGLRYSALLLLTEYVFLLFVSKSQAFGLYRFTDLTHIVFFLNQCYESSELPHRDSVCA